MNVRHFPQSTRLLAWVALGIFASVLGGCAGFLEASRFSHLEEMEAFVLCQSDEQGRDIEKQIQAEYGFKRLSGGAFRPVVPRRLFGHKIIVIEMDDMGNIVYASGKPLEFAYNFKRLLPELACENETCQAPLPDGQSLLVYKAPIKKSKNTTIIECTKTR